mgnify:CR=1 FL=1
MSTLRSFLFLLLFSSALSGFSQHVETNTLLWRITGKALARPSYLFGTIHVTDKKAFNFQDSLYRFLEDVDAFAMEVHPDSMTMLLTAYLNGDATEEYNWDNNLSQTQLKQLDQQLNKAAQKLPAGSKSRKIKYLLERLMNADKKSTDAMNTFMDAYLYEVARRHKKEIYGLEQVRDQVHALAALPKGVQFNNFLKLLEKWDPATESPIHDMYYKEDIGQMETFYRTMFTDSVLQVFLYNRNAVMVQQMDRLMQEKTLFTAVGAGHLAGSKGVIALLKQKGYQVEPVFSANRIAASDYQLKDVSLNWPVQQNRNHGFSYSMPAVPTIQSGIAGSEVALHYDLGNGLTYMVISGRLNPAEKQKGMATVKEHLDGFVQRTKATIITLDTIASDQKRMEALCKASDNSFFRYRELLQGNMFYIFTLSNRNREALYSKEAAHYFGSYKALQAAGQVWQRATYTADGFTMELPVPVKSEAVKLDAEAAEKLTWKTYSAFDHLSAINYTVHVSKALGGSELLDDWFFDHYISLVEQNTGGKEVQVTDTVINGFAAKAFASLPFNDAITKGLIVKRFNLCYYVAAEYFNGQSAADAERFLTSFALTPFQKSRWQQEASPDGKFAAWVPGSIQQFALSDSIASDGATSFYAYDAATADNYMIRVVPLSKYLWAHNIDSVYNYWTQQSINFVTDTIISCAAVTNGGLPARALTIKNKKTGLQSKLRFVLNGDEMYELGAVVPPVFADVKNIDSFLQSFTLSAPAKESYLFTNHPRLLFMDLQLEDSSYFTNAYLALDALPFSATEVPLLMQQSLQPFPETAEGYESVNVKLLNKLQQVLNHTPGGRDTILQFVKQHYHSLDAGVQHVQYTMLAMLAEDDRPEAYTLLNELLQHKPAEGFHYSLFYALYGKARAATLFPQLFQYAADASWGPSVLVLANNLLDSGFLSIDVVKTLKAQWVQQLTQHLKGALKDKEAAGIILPLIELAGRLKATDLNSLVVKYANAKDNWIKFEAVTTLLKNGVPVPATALQALAADKYFRSKLYQQLKQNSKAALFPAAYKSQKSMAESYIYAALVDEDAYEGEPKFIYIKTVEHAFNGEIKRFFLFRLNMDESDEVGDVNPTSLLSVAGPFELNHSKIDIGEKNNVSGAYYNSNFDGMLLDAMFKKYLQPFTKSRTE